MPTRSRRRPEPNPLLIPAVIVIGGLSAVCVVVAVGLIAWQLSRRGTAPPPIAAAAAPPAAVQSPAAPPAATSVAAVTTPEPADAHPGLTKADPLDRLSSLPRSRRMDEARVAERRAWYAAQLAPDVAKAHPAHAAVVRAATDAQLDILGRPHHRNLDLIERRRAALAKAIDAGSEDPAVVYAFGKFVAPVEPANLYRTAALRFNGGGYSAVRRLYANFHDAVTTRASRPSQSVEPTLKEFWQAAAELNRQPGRVADELLLDICKVALNDPLFGPDVHTRHRQLDAGLATAGASDWLRAVVDGKHHIDWAWEARGRGWANAVTEEGWRLFKQRLGVAGERLTYAHKLAPDRAAAATGMITVCMGLGSERAVMEQWFSVAIDADPDDTAAAAAKLSYLSARWHGSEEEQLAFARQCLRKSTPDDYYGELMLSAYKDIRGLAGDDEVWARPQAWADLRAAYEPYLIARPTDVLARTRFFRVCVRCGQWEAADGHRRLLGDGYSRDEIVDPAEWKRLTALVDANLTPRR